MLERRQPRFILDSCHDPAGETDEALCEKLGVVTQYVMPLATTTMAIGTLQIDMGKRYEKPAVDCMMLDAIAAHLSTTIERYRALDQLHTAQSELVSRSRLIAYEASTAYITHRLNASIGNYAAELHSFKRKSGMFDNRNVSDFVKLTHDYVTQWIGTLEGATSSFKRVEDTSLHLIEAIIKGQIEFWHRKASAWHCSISAIYGANGAQVRGRLQAIQELITCLLVNGIEAGARRIIVSTERVTRTISPEELRKDYVEILIKDDGEGVPLEYRTRTFDLGWTTKSRRGHGMGLTMIALLTKEMDGTFELRSFGKTNNDPWTEFTLLLPLTKN